MYYFSCPTCGNNTHFFRVRETATDGQAPKIQCAECGVIFPKPPLPGSPLAAVALWGGAILPVSLLLGFLYEQGSWLGPDHLGRAMVLGVSRTVMEHSLAIAAGLLCALILTAVYVIFITRRANAGFRQKIRAKYETEPKGFRPAQQNPESPDWGKR